MRRSVTGVVMCITVTCIGKERDVSRQTYKEREQHKWGPVRRSVTGVVICITVTCIGKERDV